MITHGTVRYEDGVKAAEEFAPARKAMVELHFEVPEGGDYDEIMGYVQDEARDRVRDFLKQPAAVTKQRKPKVEKEEAPGAGSKATESTATPPSAPKEIGNDDLLNAVTKKNAELNDAPRILAMMAKHIPEGTQAKVQNIPKDNRAAFLAELETMGK